MKVNLSLKITGILLLFSSVLFIGFSFFYFSNLKNALTESFIERSKATIHSIESGISDKEYFNDTNKLLLIIQKNIWLDPDIEDISFYIPQGDNLILYVSNNPNKVNQKSDQENKDSFSKDIFISKIIKNKSTEILESVDTIHISGEILGTVQINFDLASINKKIETSFFQVLLIYVVMIFLFLLLIYFFLNIIILKPISKINRGLKALAQNDYTYKIDVNSKDEIGSLATAFGEMMTVLSGTKSEIEAQVKKQTKSISEKSEELDNQKIAILNILEDVEKDKNKIELLAQDLEKFKLAVENASDQIIITDADGIVVYGNNAVEKITGFKPEEALGKKVGTLWKAPMSHEYYEKMWNTIKEKKEVFKGEIQNKRKNGELYYANISISPVLDIKNKIIYFVGIEHDITKEKEIEKGIIEQKEKVEKQVKERTKELWEEQARLLASINSLSFAFAIVDMEHNIIVKNKTMIELFGFKEDEDVNIEKMSEKLGKHFDIKIEANQCLKGNTVCENKAIVFGNKFLRSIIAPIVVVKEHEEKIGYVLLLEDITEVKIMERSKEEFFAVASHELRTPLTAIRGNTEMILDMYADKVKDKDVKEMLGDIQEASVRLIGIVNDFLDVSRLEQGKVILQNTKFDITEIIEKVIKTVKKGAEDKGLFIKFDKKDKSQIFVFADKDKTEQVLFNLLGNSIKFTVKGGVTVSIDTGESFVKINVFDTGPGISEENENLLFRKFQPAGSEILARDVTKSTGLGLYISRLIVSKMGGSIGLEKSVVGEGSKFFFTLPSGPLG